MYLSIFFLYEFIYYLTKIKAIPDLFIVNKVLSNTVNHIITICQEKKSVNVNLTVFIRDVQIEIGKPVNRIFMDQYYCLTIR